MTTITLSFKIEEICCYYLCKHTYQIFKQKDNCSHSLLISKCRDINQMIIISKECQDFVLSVYTPSDSNFFSNIKKMSCQILSKRFKRKKYKS